MDIIMVPVSGVHIPITIRTILLVLVEVISTGVIIIADTTVAFTVVLHLPVLTTVPVRAVQVIISLWKEGLLLVRQDQLSEITAETSSNHVEERSVMVFSRAQVVLLPEHQPAARPAPCKPESTSQNNPARANLYCSTPG
jgi:hypothetical protein